MGYTVRDEYLSMFGCRASISELSDRNSVEILEEDFGMDLSQLREMVDEMEY